MAGMLFGGRPPVFVRLSKIRAAVAARLSKPAHEGEAKCGIFVHVDNLRRASRL
ncbi:MAG TPA: hypothetical protein VM253_11515 [Candidatus Limnocylindrales bacterium]|nr:hypothetical protein [Candidatus Limnocylindrales bacterium]